MNFNKKHILALDIKAIDAFIFDADGTLVDTEAVGLDVVHAWALRLGISLSREAAHQQFRGVRMADVAVWLLAHASVEPPHLPALEQLYAQIRDDMAEQFRAGVLPMPGAEALLDVLAAQQVPFCVATNGPPEKIDLTLAQSGLASRFGARVYSAYTVGHFKPAPGLFLHAAHALGVPAARCVVVEDSLPGVEAAVAADMHVLVLLPMSALPLYLQQHPQVWPIADLATVQAWWLPSCSSPQCFITS